MSQYCDNQSQREVLLLVSLCECTIALFLESSIKKKKNQINSTWQQAKCPAGVKFITSLCHLPCQHDLFGFAGGGGGKLRVF